MSVHADRVYTSAVADRCMEEGGCWEGKEGAHTTLHTAHQEQGTTSAHYTLHTTHYHPYLFIACVCMSVCVWCAAFLFSSLPSLPCPALPFTRLAPPPHARRRRRGRTWTLTQAPHMMHSNDHASYTQANIDASDACCSPLLWCECVRLPC